MPSPFARLHAIAQAIPAPDQPVLARDKRKSLSAQLEKMDTELEGDSPENRAASRARMTYLRRALARQKCIPDIDEGLQNIQAYIASSKFGDKQCMALLSRLIHTIQKEMRLLGAPSFDKDKIDRMLNQLNRLKSIMKQMGELPPKQLSRSIKEPLYNPRRVIKHLRKSLMQYKGIQTIDRELEDIQRGVYQEQLLNRLAFSARAIPDHSSHAFASHDFGEYLFYQLMYEPGFRCTVAIPAEPVYHELEILVDFEGTKDFASLAADLDKGGPGQELLKQHEATFMQQINGVIEQLSLIYPNQTFRLRMAGHSLGGALAKGMAHSLQRACALQEESPEEIVKQITANLDTLKKSTNCPHPGSLKNKLETDIDKFKNLDALKKISGITVYALGAPGVSRETDRHATLMTWYHHPDFLRVYNHFHHEDIIPKFGECELFNGINGVPRILANKAIQFDTEITNYQVKYTCLRALPFPGVTRRVMLAHNATIYKKENIRSTVTESAESRHLSEKYVFSALMHALYDAGLAFAKFLASFKIISQNFSFFHTYPGRPVSMPNILEDKNVSSFHNL